eukprot:3079583-Pyramimonas_sp.AAC.1
MDLSADPLSSIAPSAPRNFIVRQDSVCAAIARTWRVASGVYSNTFAVASETQYFAPETQYVKIKQVGVVILERESVCFLPCPIHLTSEASVSKLRHTLNPNSGICRLSLMLLPMT